MKPKKPNHLRKEILLITLGVLFLGAGPVFLVWMMTPPEFEFGGTLVNMDDLSVYLSAIRQGREGNWLFEFTFSSEEMLPRLTYIPYLLLGHFSRIGGGTPLFWFHLLRVAGGIIAVLALVEISRVIFPNQKRVQLTALVLLAFGSGMGWFLAPFTSPDSPYLADLNIPEWNLSTSLIDSPHFILGIGLEILFINTLIRLTQNTHWKLIMQGFLLSIGVGLVYPFHIPIIGLGFGLYMLFLVWDRKKIPWKVWFAGFTAILPQIPFLYYYAAITRQDPLWEASHIQYNIIEPPPILGLGIGTGLLGILAFLGVRGWFKKKMPALIPIWAVVNILVLYLPVTFAGRFILGMFVPVGVMAAYSLEEVVLPKIKASNFFNSFSKLTTTPYETLRRVFILLALPSTLMVTLWTIKNGITTPDFPFFYPTKEVQAVAWLAENTGKDDLIMAYYPMGNYLPREIAGRTFIGHLNLTIDLDDKLAEVEKFWDADTSIEWREDFLEKWGIDYIFMGSFEMGISGEVVDVPGVVVYEESGVKIFKFSP